MGQGKGLNHARPKGKVAGQRSLHVFTRENYWISGLAVIKYT